MRKIEGERIKSRLFCSPSPSPTLIQVHTGWRGFSRAQTKAPSFQACSFGTSPAWGGDKARLPTSTLLPKARQLLYLDSGQPQAFLLK